MSPMGRPFGGGRGGSFNKRGDNGPPGVPGVPESEDDRNEDFANDKPTDPPESEKSKLIEASKNDFFKRKRIEITNLPNDPRPEDIHQQLFKDYPVSNVTVTDRNTARVTFVDSASAKRAIESVNNAEFRENKVSVSYAPTDNFLFLGNLALSIEESMMGDMLNPFGKVARAFLLRSLKTGYMKGCGFVEFEDREEAKNAKESLTGRFLRGRIVRTDWAPLVLNNYEELHSRTLFIDRIPKDLFDSNVLRELFAQCGKVLFCDIAINPANGESRGFGFVDFDSPDTAEKAQRMFSNYQIGNSSLRLAFGVPGRTGAHTLRQQSNSVGLNEIGANKGQMPAHPPKPHYQKPYDRQGPRPGGRPGPDSRKCFNCNELGHVARDCSKPRGDGGPRGGGGGDRGDNRTCYNCNERGHVARDCPKQGGRGDHRGHGPPHGGHGPPHGGHHGGHHQGGPPRKEQPRYPTAPGFQQQAPAPAMGAMPPGPPHMMPGMPPMPGMPGMMPGMPPMMPGMPPMVPQYPGAAMYPPGYPGVGAAPQMPPQMPVHMPPQQPAPQMYQPAPQMPQAPLAVKMEPYTSAAVKIEPYTAPLQPPSQPQNAASAVSVPGPGISHQTHLPIQPQQPAPSPVPDNTAQLLQLQTQIQQAAQQVQVLGQQAATAYSQAQQAPTNELRNQYYQQYTQLYQQQQQHQATHNTLVSQHTTLLRGSSIASQTAIRT